MKNKKIRTVITLALALSVLFSLCPVSSASNQIQTQQMKQKAFDALPDDAIVCYLRGQPVYKYEITESGRIVKEMPDVSPMAMGQEATLPLAHRGEIITATVQVLAIGYSQTEAISYLPNRDAEKLASAFESGGTGTTIAGLFISAAGIVANPVVGAMTGIVVGLYGLYNGMVASEIREITDTGGNVIVTYTNTTYGGFYSIEEWNGLTCVRYPTELTTGTMTVEVNCNHGSPWG